MRPDSAYQIRVEAAVCAGLGWASQTVSQHILTQYHSYSLQSENLIVNTACSLRHCLGWQRHAEDWSLAVIWSHDKYILIPNLFCGRPSGQICYSRVLKVGRSTAYHKERGAALLQGNFEAGSPLLTRAALSPPGGHGGLWHPKGKAESCFSGSSLGLRGCRGGACSLKTKSSSHIGVLCNYRLCKHSFW